MLAGGIHHAELILLFLLFLVAGLTALSRRFQTPYPIVLVIGGLLLSFIPNLPRISLNPNIVFLVLLPPLLFAAAYNTSWRDFRYNVVSILMLAFGLVGFTALGVAIASEYLLPGFDWRLGLALGAVVSSTDAIAATAIATRVGLPHRIVAILEGESLVNDASSLLALEFAVGLVSSGSTPAFGAGVLHLLYLVGGGLGIGLVSAWLIHAVQVRLSDPPIEITVSLMAPYVSYLLAEGLHASGPLATVACGLYLGRMSAEVFSTEARLENSAVWKTLDFLLNGIVFILIGLQLPFILNGIRTLSHQELLFDAAILTAAVIALRLLWVYPGAAIAYAIRVHVLKQHETAPNRRSIFILGWTGMRGVLALAAASSLPLTTESGSAFPQRNVILFLTFAVILVTLVLQGVTLPLVIRRLGLSEGDAARVEEREARRQMLGAAMDYLNSIHNSKDEAMEPAWREVMQHYKQRFATVKDGRPEEHEPRRERFFQVRELSQRAREKERSALLQLRYENRVSDHILRGLERELDLLDLRFEER